MGDIHENKIELDKKHLKKQMLLSLQVLRNVFTFYHMPKYFQVSDKKNPNKHILVFRHAKHQTYFVL